MIMMKIKSYFSKHILQNLSIYYCGSLVTLNIHTGESINHCSVLQDVLIESEQMARKGLEGKHGSWLIILIHAGSPLANSSTLKMEVTHSSETSVHTRSTRRHILQIEKCMAIHKDVMLSMGKKEHHISVSCRYQYKWNYHLRNVRVYALFCLPKVLNARWGYKYNY
jgi:hypothetical protein